MDQSGSYWIQKQQPCFNSHVLSSIGDSWEEQAFAEDAIGPLGGCVWPPRSYTCSFCRREFRSAQALGGHMNVHRRDRARLKKISSSNNLNINKNNNLVVDQQLCVLQNPNKMCNPNLDLDHHLHPLYPISSSHPPTRSSTLFAFSFGQDHQKGTPILPCSKFEKPQKRFLDEPKVTTLASELNISLVKRRSCDSESRPIFNNKEDEQDCLIFKKRRIDRGEEAHQSVVERSTNSSCLETLDLELRLGDHRV